MTKSEKKKSGMAATAQALLKGQERLNNLRRKFGSGLRFAVDNDVVMGYVSPMAKHALMVSQLLRKEGEFSVKNQELSLAERVASYVLLNSAANCGGVVFSLPGHHTELWGSQAGGIHARLTAELSSKGSDAEVAEEIRRFRESFYQVAISKSRDLTIDKLLDAVPNQMMGWLGIGQASMEWDRLKYLKRKEVLQAFPKEILDKPQADEVERKAFFGTLSTLRDKWQKRLETAEAEWVAKGGKTDDRTPINIRSDAVALTYLEYLNREVYRPLNQHLTLITSSGRIYDAVHGVSAAEFGREASGCADEYLLHPFDFLDECHLNLSGELRADIETSESVKLSSALEMLAEANSTEAIQHAERTFGLVWGRFLRASVLERVRRINRQQTTHLRRVAFVFSQVGISAETIAGNPLVGKLAKSGSEMLSEAADIRISSLSPDQFTRGAPILRLDKHPWAQAIQLVPPKEFCPQLVDTKKRKELLKEAGNHRYTLHLLQARAMIWAGDWKTALRLAEFALAVRDKLPEPESGAADIDGREAEFLAAVCERHAHGRDGVNSLVAALDRASSHLDEFHRLAVMANAQSENGITNFDLHVHRLRESSERLAIATTKYLVEMLISEGMGGDEHEKNRRLSESVLNLQLLSLLSDVNQLRRSALELFQNTDDSFLRYICARVLQQTWCNELQIRLFSDDHLSLITRSELERLWFEQDEIKDLISQIDVVKVPASWFVDTLMFVLGALLGHDTGQSKDAVIGRLISADLEQAVFPYDRERNSRLRKLVETSSNSLSH